MEDPKELIENNKIAIAFLVCFALASLIIDIISLVTDQFTGAFLRNLGLLVLFGMLFGFGDFFSRKGLIKRLILTALVMFLLVAIFALLKINSENRLFIIPFASLNSIFVACSLIVIDFFIGGAAKKEAVADEQGKAEQIAEV